MKAKIVESAITLIESGEIDKFSVTQVAKYMGISQGNLTYHYPTKQALVEAIIDRLLERHTIRYCQLNNPSTNCAIIC